MYQTEYRKKCIDPWTAAEQIQSGQSIHVSGACGIPSAMERALVSLIGRRENIGVTSYMHFGDQPAFYEAEGAEKTFQVATIFHNRELMKTDRLQVSSYIPTNLRSAERDLITRNRQIDWMIVGVSPMDKNGFFTITNAGLIEQALLPFVKHVIVEVLQDAPRLFGDTLLHISDVDCIVDEGSTVAVLPVRTPGETDKLLGRQVAQFVEDGSTIQLGFGGVVDALTSELKDRRDLGIHTEVVTDSTMELILSGAVNNKKKSLLKGLSVSAFWAGSKRFAEFLNDNPSFMFRNISYTNNPNVISSNNQLTSINAALQVDLTGQCASESIGPRQFSGTGGQLDFAVGSQLSPGGKSIIAIPSTVEVRDPVSGEKKKQSKIVPTLPPGAAVSLTRSNVHYVVTEFGAVCLRGLSTKERAKELISIAHPDFRAELEQQFEKIYGMRLSI